MPWRLGRIIGIGVALGTVMAVSATWMGALPTVVDPAAVNPFMVDASGTQRPKRRVVHHAFPGRLRLSPGVTYTAADRASLSQLERQVHWSIWVPTRSTVPVAFEEAYDASGIVCLWIGPYFLEESPYPIPAREGPTRVESMVLPNGTTATWWWVPGEGGVPYRLNFRAGGRYIRLSGSTRVAPLAVLATHFRPVATLPGSA
ncbi:MAG: hypothetical protein M0Z36_14105 [Thermaerobacter sp.]|nr:hypothetical protein [Thermaerobacter sp.]